MVAFSALTLVLLETCERVWIKLTIAKAIPIKAPTLLTTGVQSAPNIPAESNSGSSVSGVPSFTALEASSSNVSSHNVSTQGNKLPNATPATPQKRRYLQSFRGLMIPSTWKGASCLSSCRCRTNNPYSIPIPNSVTLLNPKLSVTNAPDGACGGGATDFLRYSAAGRAKRLGVSDPVPHGVDGSSRSG